MFPVWFVCARSQRLRHALLRLRLVASWLHKDGSSSIEWGEIVWITELFCLLAAFAMRVLSYAGDDGVDSDKDCQNDGKARLDDDQDHSSQGLGSFGNAKFGGEDQNAHHGKHTDDLDDNIDPVAGSAIIRSAPEEDGKHDSLDDELTGGLHQTRPVGRGQDAAFGEHIHNDGDEEPPISSLVIFVEDLVLFPGFLVFVQRPHVSFHFLEFPRDLPDAESPESEDGGEEAESDAGQDLCCP